MSFGTAESHSMRWELADPRVLATAGTGGSEFGLVAAKPKAHRNEPMMPMSKYASIRASEVR